VVSGFAEFSLVRLTAGSMENCGSSVLVASGALPAPSEIICFVTSNTVAVAAGILFILSPAALRLARGVSS
jgi:hypothetical protein